MKALNGVAILCLMTTLAFGQLFINEIDYNQPGTDGTEFFELAGPAGTYTEVVVNLYNNTAPDPYRTVDLGTITLTDESNGFGFFVVGSATVLNVDITPTGWTTNAFQNGDPDAIVLSMGGNIVDALSYGGELIDADGNVMEAAAKDYAGADSSSYRLGMDGSAWEYGPFSPGTINTNQTLDPNANSNPIASAGPDQIVESGAAVTLDGSGSSDLDGSIVTYLWEQVSGTTVTINNANAAIANFVVPNVTETSSWVFSLTVTDNEAGTGTDEVGISVLFSMTIAQARAQAIGTLVTVTGLVNSTNLSSSGTDYTFEDETAGIDLYIATVPLSLNLGDEIMVTGVTTNYSDKLELVPASASDVSIISTGNTLPDPQVITVAELLANGENYESELIRIDGVSFAAGNDSWPTAAGNANVNITDNGSDLTVMRIDDETEIDGTAEPVWPVDLIGIGSHNAGVYQITPRLLSDFLSNVVRPTFANATHAPAFVTSSNEITVTIDIIPGDETQSIASAIIMYGVDGTLLNESVMWLDQGNTWMGTIPAQEPNTFLAYEIIATSNDDSEFDSYTYEIAIASTELTTIASIQANPVVGQVVTIDGIVTIGGDLLQPPYTKAYIQDASGRGINLFNYDALPINRGDQIKVVGVVDVFSSTVEITDFSYELMSTGNDLPAPIILTPGQANAALWEGTLLNISGKVTETWFAGFGTNVRVGDASDTTMIRIWETTGVDTSRLRVGTDWSFLGVASQYNGVFQLLVAYDEDIVSTSAIDFVDSKPASFGLNPAYPNPFNPSTTLSWNLLEAGALSLRVFDIRGREVAHLAEGFSEAGQFSMNWNASELNSGVYFVQLNTSNNSAIQKVMLIK